MTSSSTGPRLRDFILFPLLVLLVPGCVSTQDTAIQAYTWELGRRCDTSMMTMSRVDPDGRYWVQPAPNIISVAPYLECMKEQAKLYPFTEPPPTSQTTTTNSIVALSPDAEAQRLRTDALRLYRAGQYGLAVPLAERALAIQEKAHGSESVAVAEPLNVLALLYKNLGDSKRAESLYERSIAIYDAQHVDNPAHAVVLGNLAQLYRYRDPNRAEALFQRALAIRERTLGPEHPTVAVTLNDLGSVYLFQGAYAQAQAEPLFERALAIWQKAPSFDRRFMAGALYHLAELHTFREEFARAESLFDQAIATYEKAVGPDHPWIAATLSRESRLYWIKGDLPQAIALRMRSDDIRERNIDRILLVGSETQKRLYLASLNSESQINISLHVDGAPVDKAALRLALTTILRRKGRVLDAMTYDIRAARDSARTETRSLFRRWTALRSELATLILQGPGDAGPQAHRLQVGKVSAQIEEVEKQLALRPAGSQLGAPLVTLEGVQAAIPGDTALIEFVRYSRFEPQGRGYRRLEQKYAAYVLHRTGEATWADLGEAAVVDRMVARFLEALNDASRADVTEIARHLDDQIMRPVRALIGKSRVLLVSPDAALNVIPFGALVDDTGHYLAETYTFSYLTSGRDLLHKSRASPRSGPVILADPDFEDTTSEGNGLVPVTGRRSLDFGSVTFGRLRGTAAEATAIAKMFPDVTVLTRENATEAALKDVKGPRLLHIATHGFFLSDQDLVLAAPEPWSDGADMDSGQLRFENPLLRAGLALAGANRLRSGHEDGILTALELAGLDLTGTKLVVLSACQTGVGAVSAGDGVYGLRRAVVLAGAESQVVSLWKVSDDATRDLMVMYYSLLLKGEGRAQALQRAQQEMARREGRHHPFYWAAFISVGEWGPMSEDVGPVHGE